MKSSRTELSPNQYLSLFLAGFAAIYALLPSLFYQTISPDSAQNIAWGHSWLWSYNRHAPLGTWLIRTMNDLIPNNELTTYGTSVLCLSFSLVFLYQFSKQYLEAKDALVATILSTFTYFFLNNFVLEYNQNTIMLPFWILIAYFFDRCFKDNRIQDWIFLSLSTTAALLAKYESGFIIFLIALYGIRHFKSKFLAHLLLSIILSLLLLMPHLISVAKHGFLSLKFVGERIQDINEHGFLYKHFYFPLRALFEQSCHLLPAILALLLLIKHQKIIRTKPHVYQFNYLIYLGIAPIGLIITLSMVMGIRIHAEWGHPVFIFTIPAIMYYFKMRNQIASMRRFIVIALLLHLTVLSIYMSSNYFSHKASRVNYPSYDLAKQATSYWREFSEKPILYVGGDELIDYYLTAYLPSKPQLLEAYSLKHSHWIHESDVKQQGILWVLEGCDTQRTLDMKNKLMADDYRCIKVPLSNKYKRQYKYYTLIVAKPKD